MIIRAHAAISINRPVESVFDAVTAPDAVAKTFEGHGPIPAVKHSELITEGGMRKGAIRRIHNVDGSVIDEEIIEFERPHTQAYRLMAGLKPPFTWLVRQAEGRWQLRPEGAGTHIEWVFTFHPRNVVPRLFVALMLKPPFTRAMEKCLANTRRLLEG